MPTRPSRLREAIETVAFVAAVVLLCAVLPLDAHGDAAERPAAPDQGGAGVSGRPVPPSDAVDSPGPAPLSLR